MGPERYRASERQRLARIVARVQGMIDAGALLRPHLRALDRGTAYLVLGAGKAASAMAAACAEELPLAHGLVVAARAERDVGAIRIVAGSHPVPDDSSTAAAAQILALAAGARPNDDVLFLLSGGASSLMALPAPGLSLADKQAVTRDLLASGAPIEEINLVRKHLSAIKGGRLSAATPARLRTFALSDVPGDDPAAIGSGPTVPDASTREDARRILIRWAVMPPPAVAALLADWRGETPKSDTPGHIREFTLIGGPGTALDACRAAVEADGFEAIVLGAVSGEARLVAEHHARLARDIASRGRRVALISGGELSVTLTGETGAGGRCREYLLALALAGCCAPSISAAAWDTDGVDGIGPGAGAYLFSDTPDRAARLSLDARACLGAHRSGEFFAMLGDSISMGAQPTNVGDMRLILIDRP